MTVVAPDFRNYLHNREGLEVAQFPAALHDSYSGLEWMYEHKAELGCEAIVAIGDSSGANLAMGMAMKASQEGRPELIDGSFLLAPYVASDMFSDRFPSLAENDGYVGSWRTKEQQQKMNFYTTNAQDFLSPLAWAMNAGPDDLEGMKPVMIIVNELDPLRDIGLEFYRKLLAAGVDVEAQTVMGIMHDFQIFNPVIKQFDTTANAIKGFGARLRGQVMVAADAACPPSDA